MVLSQTVQTIGAAGSVQMRIDICPDQTTEFQKFLVLIAEFPVITGKRGNQFAACQRCESR